jgi:glycosyltransferase involved in cell wall biosynthesis
MTPGIAVILKGYPRLSETFIAQELRALEQHGLHLHFYSLRHPTDTSTHPIHREITAPVTYLPEYLHDEPVRVWRAWRMASKMPGYPRARKAFLRDLIRDRTPNRIRRFGQACVLAAELPPGITRLYAHFLHTPASVARYAALMTGLPWCASAHAKDIWTTPDWEKREKLAELEWLVTCTAVGRDHLAELAPDPAKVGLVYHGLDLTRFGPNRHQTAASNAGTSKSDGSDSVKPVILLSVGRAVEKKGYEDLLTALARLPEDLHWRLVHIGGGKLNDSLQALGRKLGIAARIDWLGAQPQEVVLENYRRADLFVLASRIGSDGDRDGLPNVLMEAQSQGVACLSTAVSAIPELIRDGETGVLVPPDSPAELSAALQGLITDPDRRQRLGIAGYERVKSEFAMENGINALLKRFGEN